MMFIGTWLYLFSTFHVTENFIWLSELKKVWKKRLKKIQRNRWSWQSTKWLTSHWAIYNWWVPPKTRKKKKKEKGFHNILNLMHPYLIYGNKERSYANMWLKVMLTTLERFNITELSIKFMTVLKSSQCMFSLLKDYTLQHFTHRPITMYLIWALFFFFSLGLTSRKWWRIAWFRISWKYFLGSSFLKVWNHPYPPAWTD